MSLCTNSGLLCIARDWLVGHLTQPKKKKQIIRCGERKYRYHNISPSRFRRFRRFFFANAFINSRIINKFGAGKRTVFSAKMYVMNYVYVFGCYFDLIFFFLKKTFLFFVCSLCFEMSDHSSWDECKKKRKRKRKETTVAKNNISLMQPLSMAVEFDSDDYDSFIFSILC